jgi:GTP-binding protein Era
VAALGPLQPDDVEEVWHGLEPPYESLFAWAEGRAGRPEADDPAPFRPPMLAHPIEDADFDESDDADEDDDGEDASEPAAAYTGDHRCGFAALVGRPNVGKSTLMNALLERKLSIVTPKPQTTRHRIVGILNTDAYQIAFVDTPGIHSGQKRALNQAMNRSALASLDDSDVLVFVVEALRFTDEDERVLTRIKSTGRPAILVVNKVDRVTPRERLLPFMAQMAERHPFVDVVPLSARRHGEAQRLASVIAKHLPASPPLYPPDQVTESSPQFLATEIIREKLTLQTHEELPYGLTVEIEQWTTDEETGRFIVGAVIWVEREGQKAIVIGDQGGRLKEVGRAARYDLNELLGKRIHLELWVKVKENWADNANQLRRFGYDSA